jgi:hypothetical protein
VETDQSTDENDEELKDHGEVALLDGVNGNEIIMLLFKINNTNNVIEQ